MICCLNVYTRSASVSRADSRHHPKVKRCRTLSVCHWHCYPHQHNQGNVPVDASAVPFLIDPDTDTGSILWRRNDISPMVLGSGVRAGLHMCQVPADLHRACRLWPVLHLCSARNLPQSGGLQLLQVHVSVAGIHAVGLQRLSGDKNSRTGKLGFA